MRKVLYILGELGDSDLQWLLDAGSLRTVQRGTTLIEEGKSNQNLFILVEGELLVSRSGLELARLGAGEVVGDMSLIDSRPPSATVGALQTSKVFAVPQRALHAKLERDSQFAARFYRALCVFLANRLRRTGAMLGAAAVSGAGRLDEGEDAEPTMDEISPDSLDTMALAGARFHWFLQEVRRR